MLHNLIEPLSTRSHFRPGEMTEEKEKGNLGLAASNQDDAKVDNIICLNIPTFFSFSSNNDQGRDIATEKGCQDFQE